LTESALPHLSTASFNPIANSEVSSQSDRLNPLIDHHNRALGLQISTALSILINFTSEAIIYQIVALFNAGIEEKIYS
jgi:hypothetical protein